MTKYEVRECNGVITRTVNDEAYDTYYDAIVALVDEMYKYYYDVEDFDEILENTLYEAQYNPDFFTFLNDCCYHIEQIEEIDDGEQMT